MLLGRGTTSRRQYGPRMYQHQNAADDRASAHLVGRTRQRRARWASSHHEAQRDHGGVHRLLTRLRYGRRWTAMVACLGFAGWLWWNAQADHYAGLSINTVGQLLGDLLTAGLTAPMTRRYRTRRRSCPCPRTCPGRRGQNEPATPRSVADGTNGRQITRSAREAAEPALPPALSHLRNRKPRRFPVRLRDRASQCSYSLGPRRGPSERSVRRITGWESGCSATASAHHRGGVPRF